MIAIKSKYLVKCDMPFCVNVAVSKYIIGEKTKEGLQLCDKCIKGMYDIIKRKVSNKGENNEKK